ncbi:MAG: hypothetical protein D6690_11655 [Nitrospirae bacterium]|nr:MAG: hypothetical protein D6690_11655 [Nitrospirota bacterium]
MNHPPLFTREELALIADTTFFPAKTIITRKVKQMLERLHAVLSAELADRTLIVPPGFDADSVQFVKGEHLEDFPYQYLDFPRFFSRENTFAFRSLFWWGHHVVFALMLAGINLRRYKENLFNRYADVADRRLVLCLSPSFWEWKEGPGLTLDLTRANKSQVAAVLANRPSIKVARFVSLTDPIVQSGQWIDVGLAAFRGMLPIVTE